MRCPVNNSMTTHFQKNGEKHTVLRLLRSLLGIIALLPFSSATEQKSAASPVSSGVIVEVIATDYQFHTSIKYVYLRVSADGTVEYHDPWHIDLFKPDLIRKSILPDQVDRLKAVLSKPENRSLSGEYQGNPGVDTSLRWDISFPTMSERHDFTLWNFTYGPRGGPQGRTITEPARRMGCILEEISNHAKGSDRHSVQCVKASDIAQ